MTLHRIDARITGIYDALATKVDVEHLKSADYQETLAQMVEFSVRDAEEEKREYLVAFAANYSLCERPEKTYKDMFARIIRDLSGAHIRLLAILYEYQEPLSDPDLDNLLSQPQRSESLTVHSLAETLRIDERLVVSLVVQMVSFGLVRLSEPPLSQVLPDSIVVLTRLSKDFICFLHADWNN